jgi:hypothetical protein
MILCSLCFGGSERNCTAYHPLTEPLNLRGMYAGLLVAYRSEIR